MSRRVGNGSQSALKVTGKKEALEVQAVDNGFQVPDPRLEREVPGGPVGGAGPASVVTDNPKACGGELISATPGA